MLSLQHIPPLLREHVRTERMLIGASLLVNIGLLITFLALDVPLLMVVIVVFAVMIAPLVYQIYMMFKLPLPDWLQSVDHSVCGSCGYILKDCNARGCCPECGEPYDLPLVRTYWLQYCEDYPSPKWKRRKCALHWDRDIAGPITPLEGNE